MKDAIAKKLQELFPDVPHNEFNDLTLPLEKIFSPIKKWNEEESTDS